MKKSKTLAQTMSDTILNMIRENGYVPGDKLPTESELCEQLGAGRNTIREALKILASKNIITIRQGAGSFVSERQGLSDDPLGFAMVSNRQQLTEDLFEVLIILEPSIAGLAAQSATEEDIRQLEEIVAKIEDAIRQKQDYSKLDAQFHCKVAESAHNIVMKNLTPVIESGIIFYSKEFDRADSGAHFHRTLFEYIRDHRALDASSEMRYHLLFDKHHYRQKNPSS